MLQMERKNKQLDLFERYKYKFFKFVHKNEQKLFKMPLATNKGLAIILNYQVNCYDMFTQNRLPCEC